MSSLFPEQSDDANGQATPAVGLTELRARIADRAIEIVDAEARLDAARSAAQAALADYRATPAGLAESLRGLERAMLSGQQPKAIRRAQQQHMRAELAAAREYRERAARWGHRPGDGPLMACPIGADGAFATWMLALDITGTYRYDAARADATITAQITRPSTEDRGRVRARITVPAALISREGLTLRNLLAYIAERAEQQTRIRRVLGDHMGRVLASLGDDPATC